MVLAAGRGQRMQPLSRAIPKPALPIVEQPLVASAFAQAAAAGVSQLVVNVHHLPESMAAAARQAAASEGVTLALSEEEELMDTAGGLALARDRGLLGDEGPVLVLNGDGLLRLDLAPLVARHERGDQVTLALLPHLDPRRWTRVLVDPTGTVTELRAAGPPLPGEVPFLYPGVMLVSRAILNRIVTTPCGARSALWEPALAAGQLGAAVVHGHWREVGHPTQYLNAVVEALDGQRWVHPSARVAPTAAIGTAMIGRRAVVEADAVVAESVVAEGAVVRAGARVVRSVLLGAVEAATDERVVCSFRSA